MGRFTNEENEMSEGVRHIVYQFEVIKNITSDVWETMKTADDSSIFFTREWDDYQTKMGKKRIVVSVSSEGKIVGYFLGSKFWAGIKVIMAPSMGTGTYTQGLCMLEPITEIERIEIYKQLVAWLFKKKKADYIQIRDLQIREESKDWKQEWHHALLDKEGIHYTPRYTFLLDVQKTEEELWADLHYKSCKYCVNKARKNGLTIKIIDKAEDIEPFINQHNEHMQDMFRRKKTTGLPSQQREALSLLCHSLFPHHVLMLQVIGKDADENEVCMSSCIFANGKAGSGFCTSASFQKYMHYCPNELMVWEAIRVLHSRAAGVIDMGGTADYKKKFGPTYALIPMMTFSRYKALHGAYITFKKIYARLLTLLGHFK